MAMRETYTSNLYVNVDPPDISIKVYVVPLKSGIPEYMVLQEIKRLVDINKREAYMSVVTHGKLYTSSISIIKELGKYIQGRPNVTIITNNTDEYAKVIGNLTYRSLDLFFQSKGFRAIPSKAEKGKRIYYKKDDPYFVLEIRKPEATFKAIRGLNPKVYANIPGKLQLFFIPDGSHIIEVHDWNAFVDEKIKVKQKYLRELNEKDKIYSKVFKLKKVKDNIALIDDLIYNKTLEAPLENIYVPANTHVLHKFEVLKDLQAFTSFRENENMTEYKFLERALSSLLPNIETFSLKIGLTEVTFHRVLFVMEDDNNEHNNRTE